MAARRPGDSGQLRIIGGRWRGRKLRFKAAEGLRPTPDRVRETLFNWLAPAIHGARCLDLFAGSGALGLEALSRGADHVQFIDTQRRSIASIEEHLTTLACDHAACQTGDGQQWLARGNTGPRFDIVFLDPPFNRGMIEPAAEALEAHHWLAEDAFIYVETSSHEDCGALPGNWQLHREKTAGDVRSALFVRSG